MESGYSQGAPPHTLSQHRPKGHTNHQTLHLAVSPDSFPRQQMPPHASVYLLLIAGSPSTRNIELYNGPKRSIGIEVTDTP